MKIKLENGEEVIMAFGGNLTGMRIREVTLNVADMRYMRNLLGDDKKRPATVDYLRHLHSNATP
jgi:hypothetical protein